MATTTRPIHDAIYAALTYNTGAHMLDSGGAYGRNWERNQRLSLADMLRRPSAWIDKDATYLSVTLDTFHYLADRLVTISADHPARVLLANTEEASPDASWFEVVNEYRAALIRLHGGDPDAQHQPLSMSECVGDIWNTYNWENLLGQVLQGFGFTMPDDDAPMVCLQVHGGCDVRGGYTRPYVFRLDAYPVSTADYAVGCFLAEASDAEVYCSNPACVEHDADGFGGWGFQLRGGDVIYRDGSYGVDWPEGADWATLTCPQCGTVDSIRAEAVEPSY